jgi:hypothetical protein
MTKLALVLGPALGIARVPTNPVVGAAGVISFKAVGAVGDVVWRLVESNLPDEWADTFTVAGGIASIETANVLTPGTFTIRVRAVDSFRQPVEADFTVRVQSLPITISGSLPQWVVGAPTSTDLTISGGSGIYASAGISSGSFPSGISISLIGSNLRVSGTPTEAGSGVVTLFVIDSDNSEGYISVAWDSEAAPDVKTVISSLSPWSYWPLDDATSPFVDIQAGRNINTVYGSVTTQQSGLGAIGPCLHLAPGSIFSNQHNSDLATAFGGSSKPISIVAIVGNVGPGGHIIHIGNNVINGSQGITSKIYYDAPNWEIDIGLRASNTWLGIDGEIGGSLPSIMVVCITRSIGGAASIYVNGSVVATTASGLAGDMNIDNSSPLTIGALNQGGSIDQLTGDIAHVALFNRVLTGSEIGNIVAAAGVSP